MTMTHDKITTPQASERTPDRPDFIETSRGIGRIEGFYGNTDEKLLAELLPIRENFVIDKMHWRGIDHKEGDPYDITPETLQLALRIGEGDETKVLSSLRLTRVESMGDALSVHMMTDNERMFHEAQDTARKLSLDATAARGNLYDLTRLVSNIDENDSIDDVLGSFMELFGAAAGTLRNKTPDDNDKEDIKWIFVITDTIRSVLEAQGVEMTELTSGYVTDYDEKRGWKSHFFLVNQESAIRSVKANADALPKSYPHLQNGLAKTGWNL